MYTGQNEGVFNSALASSLAVIAVTVFSAGALYLFNLETASFTVWLVRFTALEVFLVVWRTAAAVLIKKYGKKTTCLILENKNNTSRLARKLKYASNYGREVTYYLLDEDNKDEIDAVINEKIKLFDQIFISPAISQSLTDKIVQYAAMTDKAICVLADFDRVSIMRGRIYQLGDTPVLEKKSVYMTKLQRFVKRIFDILVSLVMCIVFLPAFLICAIAIHIDSKGPVFYKQQRYTVGKKVFNVYKFRTMVQNAEQNGAQLATDNDPRITKVGRILRATRLDELPQLYNILFGHMSIVGPRPERPVFADEFSKTVANYDMRYCVKAGLTGYAQVYGKYNTSVEDKILMDMIYIVNYSLLLDIKLVLLTVKTMFNKSSTSGVDEERAQVLASEENEVKRREETLRMLGLKKETDEEAYQNTGV